MRLMAAWASVKIVTLFGVVCRLAAGEGSALRIVVDHVGFDTHPGFTVLPGNRTYLAAPLPIRDPSVNMVGGLNSPAGSRAAIFWDGSVRETLSDDPGRPAGARGTSVNKFSSIDCAEKRNSTAHTVAKQRVCHPQQAVNCVSTTLNNDSSYDPYAPPKLPDYITLLPDGSASQQLPSFPELEVSALGGSSQLTDITPVMEP